MSGQIKPRYITEYISQLALRHGKMAFLSGPRQCGKTTLAKAMLADRQQAGRYHNWDSLEFRRLWTTAPSRTAEIQPADLTVSSQRPLVVYDEIHKARGWKRTLKGVYDTLDANLDIIVTGSARLNVFMRGGDSLLGRYLHFHLHPFSLGEMVNRPIVTPDQFISAIFDEPIFPETAGLREHLSILWEFGGFPEPLLRQDKNYLNIWQSSRTDAVIRQDLRDLSRVQELSKVEMLAALIPSRIGSLFSRESIRRDLEVSFESVKRWVQYLNELYYLFEVKPYHRKIARSLKKEGKVYLWDYSELDDPGARFENMVACHLLKACDFWSDTGSGTFELQFLRDREKNEIDFLIVRDNKPWLAIEAKCDDTKPVRAFTSLLPQLGLSRAIQVVWQPCQRRLHHLPSGEVLVCPAEQILGLL